MNMTIKTIQTKGAPEAIGPYSQAIAANGFLFTAGQIPLHPETGQVEQGDIKAQTELVLSNLEAVIKEAGASWGDVVKTTVFLTDLGNFPVVNEIYAARLGGARPARSTVQVSALPRGVNVEIDAVVALPGK